MKGDEISQISAISNKNKEPRTSNTYFLSSTMGLLTVYLDKCTNLKNVDLMTASDPYVSFELEQDNWVSHRLPYSGCSNMHLKASFLS